jgi:hypothetical protein
MIRIALEVLGLLICGAVAGYGILWGMAVVGSYLIGGS